MGHGSAAMTYIYHITHIDNLPMIVSTQGLVSDARKQNLPSQPANIAYADIKDRRVRKLIPCGPQGCVADYVPFYFAPRSPMLYTISRGNIPGRVERDIIYLVSCVERVSESGLGYVFTDGHPIMAITTFYDDLADLGKVDWNLMKSGYWFDVESDPDRKRRRQAEFLVRDFVPWSLIEGIAVRSGEMVQRVESCICGIVERPAVGVKRDWYYD